MNISNINGEVLQDYNSVLKYNPFYELNIPRENLTSNKKCMKIFHTFLIIKTENNKLSFFPKLGKTLISSYEISSNIEPTATDEDIIDFEFDEEYFYILTKYGIFSVYYEFNELTNTITFPKNIYSFSLKHSYYVKDQLYLDTNGITLQIVDKYLIFNNYHKFHIIIKPNKRRVILKEQIILTPLDILDEKITVIGAYNSTKIEEFNGFTTLNKKIFFQDLASNEINVLDTSVLTIDFYNTITTHEDLLEDVYVLDDIDLANFESLKSVRINKDELDIIRIEDVSETTEGVVNIINDFKLFTLENESYVSYSLLHDNTVRIKKVSNFDLFKSILLNHINDDLYDNNNFSSIISFLGKNKLELTDSIEYDIYDSKTEITSNHIIYNNITNIEFLNNSLYLVTNSNNIYKYNLDFNSISLFLQLDGNVTSMESNIDSLIITTNYKNLYVVNGNSSYKNLKIDGLVKSSFINNLFAVLEFENDKVIYYKLQNIPEIEKFYEKLEDFKILDQENVMFNSNIKLKNQYRYFNDDTYDVTIKIRSNEVTARFPEIDVRKNIYLPIDPTDSLYHDPNLYLDNYKPIYIVRNIEKDFTFNNITPANGSELVSKLLFKDFYYMDGFIYFKVKYLFKDTFMLLIRINKQFIAVGNIVDSNMSIDEKMKYAKTYVEDCTNYFIDCEDIHDEFYWIGFKSYIVNSNSVDNLEIEVIPYFKAEWGGLSPMDTNVTGKFIKTYDLTKVNSVSNTYQTSDGNFGKIENKYIRMDNLEKTTFLNYNYNLIKEEQKLLNNSLINKNPIINNNDIFDKSRGVLDLTTILPNTHKDNFNFSNIYIDGKKLFKSSYIQKDYMNGILEVLVPIRNLSQVLNTELIKKLEENDPSLPEIDLIIEVLSKKIIGNEEFLCRFTITDLDEKENILYNGNYFPIVNVDYAFNKLTQTYEVLTISAATIPAELDVDSIRLYIKNNNAGFIQRINPENYLIKIDRETNLMYIKSTGTSSGFEVGNEIILVKNGVDDNINVYSNLENSIYDIETIPLLKFTESDEIISLNIDRAEDIEVIVDNLILYPNRDYILLNTDNYLEEIPPLVLFRNKIKKNSKIEISVLGKNTGQIFLFDTTARNGNKVKTDDIISMNTDEFPFILNKFSVFVNHLRIPNTDVQILNTKTIKILNNDNINNIMIRFDIEDHVNLDEILYKYKYSKIYNDDYYHSSYENLLKFKDSSSSKLPIYLMRLEEDEIDKIEGNKILVDDLKSSVGTFMNTLDYTNNDLLEEGIGREPEVLFSEVEENSVTSFDSTKMTEADLYSETFLEEEILDNFDKISLSSTVTSRKIKLLKSLLENKYTVLNCNEYSDDNFIFFIDSTPIINQYISNNININSNIVK